MAGSLDPKLDSKLRDARPASVRMSCRSSLSDARGRPADMARYPQRSAGATPSCSRSSRSCKAYDEIAFRRARPAPGSCCARPPKIAEMKADGDRRDQGSLEAQTRGAGARAANVGAVCPSDPNDAKNVVLEVRAGTWAARRRALFAAELFRMYARFAESNGWKVRTTTALSETPAAGGVKEVIAIIEGERRVQPAQVRERRAPGPARAGNRGAGTRPHLRRHGGRAPGSRGRRRRDRRERPADRHLLLLRVRGGRASTRPSPPCASPTFRRASSCSARTRSRGTRTRPRR